MAQSLPLLHALSNVYMSENVGENSQTAEFSDNIIIHRKLLHKITNNRQQETIHVVLQNTESPSCRVYGTIGWPHYDDPGTIYLPTWMVEKLGVNTPYAENSEPLITLEVYNHPIPVATHIVFKSIYSEKQIDALRNCLEESLHGFHILEEKTLFHTNEGDYVSIEKTEPGTIVRLGGEVSIEIQNEACTDETTSTGELRKTRQHDDEIHTGSIGNTGDSRLCLSGEEDRVRCFCGMGSSGCSSHNSVHQNTIREDGTCDKTPEQRREEVRNSWLNKFKK